MFVSLQLGSALIGITSYCIFVYVQYTDTSYAYVATPLDSNFSVYNVLARGNTKRYICKSKRAVGVTFLTQSFHSGSFCVAVHVTILVVKLTFLNLQIFFAFRTNFFLAF